MGDLTGILIDLTGTAVRDLTGLQPPFGHCFAFVQHRGGQIQIYLMIGWVDRVG